MEPGNPLQNPTPFPGQLNQAVNVRSVGFANFEVAKFQAIFQAGHQKGLKFSLLKPTDTDNIGILLINFDNAQAVAELKTLQQSFPNAQVVGVSRGPLVNAPNFHIRGMLMTERVLGILDKARAEFNSKGAQPPDPPRPPATEPRQEAKPDTNYPTEPRFRTPVPRPGLGDPLKPTPAVTPNIVHPAPEAIAKVAPAPPEENKTTAQGGWLALVVDDSIAIQKSIENHLKTIGQVSCIDFAESGEQAIEKAEQTQYDLIFLDIMMPGIDGYETCTRLRKKPEYKKTPIVMVTGKTSPLDEVKGIIAGATTYLTKPVQPEQFQKVSSRVVSWLEGKKSG